MPKIITLAGNSNAGKTTVSSHLVTILPKTVQLDLDNLRHIARYMPISKHGPYLSEDGATLVKNWVERGYDVIIQGAFNEKNYRDFQDLLLNLMPNQILRYHHFVLIPPLELILQQRGDRIVTEADIERIKDAHKNRFHRTNFGIKVDNRHQTPEETAEIIAKHVRYNTPKADRP